MQNRYMNRMFDIISSIVLLELLFLILLSLIIV